MVYNLYEVTVSLLRERGLEIKDIAELVLFFRKSTISISFHHLFLKYLKKMIHYMEQMKIT